MLSRYEIIFLKERADEKVKHYAFPHENEAEFYLLRYLDELERGEDTSFSEAVCRRFITHEVQRCES